MLPVLLSLGRVSVDEVYGNERDAETLQVGEAGDWTGGMIIVSKGAGVGGICPLHGLVERGENFVGFEGWNVQKSTPDLGTPKSRGCKTSDDTKIVGAAFKCMPKVRIC